MSAGGAFSRLETPRIHEQVFLQETPDQAFAVIVQEAEDPP